MNLQYESNASFYRPIGRTVMLGKSYLLDSPVSAGGACSQWGGRDLMAKVPDRRTRRSIWQVSVFFIAQSFLQENFARFIHKEALNTFATACKFHTVLAFVSCLCELSSFDFRIDINSLVQLFYAL